MAVSGVTSDLYGSYYTYNYGYNNSSSGISSDSWGKKATEEADKLKESLGISSTDKTGTSSKTNTTASNVSGFLMGYQTRLEDLETSASKLQLNNKNNVFDKYDAVKAKADKGEATADDLTKAAEEVYSAVKDLADKYNSAVDYLKNNTQYGEGLSSQLDSLKRGMPTEQGLKYFGMSYDTSGNVKVDKDEFMKTFQSDSNYVKDSFGGQYGIADRLGAKASAILDSSVDKVLGSGATDGVSDGDSSKPKVSSSPASETYGGSTVNTANAANVNDSFKQFASFARSGAFNLSNYYAVSMLNILA